MTPDAAPYILFGMPSCMGYFVRFVKYGPKNLASFVSNDTLH